MKRQGMIELLGVMLMLAFFATFFSMFLQPTVVYNGLQLATDDLDPRTSAGSISNLMEDGYFAQAINYSFYQTSYDSARAGAGLDYHVQNVPSQQEVTASLIDDAETAIENNYISERAAGEGCSIDGNRFPEIGLSIYNHSEWHNDTAGIMFNTTLGGGTATITCESDVSSSSFSMSIPRNIYSIDNRYFEAYNRTRDILRNESLNRFIDDVHQNASTTATVTTCVNRPTSTGCGYIEPDKPYGDELGEDDYIVRKYERKSGQQLSNYLDGVEAYYNETFAPGNFTVSLEVMGVEYRPYTIESEHHTIQTGNQQDNSDTYDSGTEGCGEDDDPPDCDGSCSLDDSEPTSSDDYSSYCTDNGYPEWDGSFEISTSTTAGTVEDDAEPITDDPWTQSSDSSETSGSCNYQVDDPYPSFSVFEWGPSPVDNDAFFGNRSEDVGLMLPMLEDNIERTRGCSCDQNTCTRNLNAELKRRSQYNFSLQTVVEIRVSVTDNRSDLFVDGETGEDPLKYVTEYTYRSWDGHPEAIDNWNFDYEPATGQDPSEIPSCSDAPPSTTICLPE